MPKFMQRAVEEVRHWTRSDWSLADTAAHYDHLAQDYDAINESTAAHFRRFEDALRMVDLPEAACVLEIFSRTGEGMAYFYQQGKVKSAICVDVSPEMGKICRQRLQDAGLSAFMWLEMRDYHLPIADGVFDVVFCLETVEHVSRPDQFVLELGRVTKSGGGLVLSTPNVLWEPVHGLAAIGHLHHSEGPHRFIRYKRLLDIVREAGFHIEHVETNVLIPEGPDWLIRLGDWLERSIMRPLLSFIGLRRFLVGRRM